MLEYFTYKKVKKHQEEKAQKERQDRARDEAKWSTPATPNVVVSQSEEPVRTYLLDNDDERFLERLTSPDGATAANDDVEGPPPPLPPRVHTPTIDWDSDAESYVSKKSAKGDDVKGKSKAPESAKGEKKADNKRASTFAVMTSIGRSMSRRVTARMKPDLHPARLDVPEGEVMKEETEISRVLEDLNLSAQNNKAFSLSAESTEMVRKFTQVLKDLVNGVPTAYQDLVNLIEDRDGILAKNYEKLPNSMKKLVTTLPDKLTSTLAPELLAVAAEAQGLRASEAGSAGLKDAAKNFLKPNSLKDLVTKPGAVASLLKGIVSTLKTRWPAFIGTNVLWSVAIFLLLSMLWYCHRRGREVRLEKEANDAAGTPLDGASRIEELPDDPQLPAPGQARAINSPTFPVSPGANMQPSPVAEYAGRRSPAGDFEARQEVTSTRR